jgi:hypothetical protein
LLKKADAAMYRSKNSSSDTRIHPVP